MTSLRALTRTKKGPLDLEAILGHVDKCAHVTRFGSFVPKSRLLAWKYYNIPRVAARNLNSKALEWARSGICPRGLILQAKTFGRVALAGAAITIQKKRPANMYAFYCYSFAGRNLNHFY